MKNPSTFPDCDDEALLKSVSSGDLDAFNQLVLKYQDMAYQHALTLLGDADQAEDATQESFIKAFQNIGNFYGGSLRSWLLRIVTNTVYDMFRKFKRHPTQALFFEDDDGIEVDSPAWLADPGPSVQDILEQRELSEEISRLLCELPEVYRSVLTLIDILEFDYTEAAQSLNIPIGTVKSRIARARLQMREMLSGGRVYGNTFGRRESNPAPLVEMG